MMSSADRNYCDLVSTSEADGKSVEKNCPITVLLNIEVNRIQTMVNILEELERGLEPSEQNNQTSSDKEQTRSFTVNQVI